MRDAHCFGLVAVMVAIAGIAAAPQHEGSHESRVLRIHVPPANSDKYRTVTDAAHWKNPYLIVQPSGVEARTSGAAVTGPIMPVADVIEYLKNLPKGAWPSGLAVAVQENGVISGEDAERRIQRNRLELMRHLNEEKVKVELWPSA